MNKPTKLSTEKPKAIPQMFMFSIACVEVTFVDGEGGSGVTRINSMIKSENGNIGIALLGRTQQAAQMQLIERLNDPTIQILNVVFVSICPLGFMSEEEFQNNGRD